MIRVNGIRLAAWVFAALSAVVMLFHTAAILGAPVGHLTMGGRWPGVLPPAARLLSVLSLGVIGLTAMVVLARAGVIRRTLPSWNMRAVLAYLALAILMHIATPSAAERKLWLPVILMLTASAVWVELRAGGAPTGTST
jgi:hypothetical protein